MIKIYRVEEVGKGLHRENEKHFFDYDKAEKELHERIEEKQKGSIISADQIEVTSLFKRGDEEIVSDEVVLVATIYKKLKGSSETCPVEIRVVEINVL